MSLIKIYLIPFVILVITLLLYTLLINNGILPSTPNDVKYKTIFLSIIFFFFVGLIAGNINQKNGILNGIIYFFFPFLLIIIYNALNGNSFSSFSVIKLGSCLLFSIIGGILGIRFKKIF